MAGLIGGAIAGGISGLFNVGVGIANLIQSGHIHPQFTPYQIPAEIQQQLGLAQTQQNAAMPGTAEYEREIQQQGANASGAIARGAKGSSSYLASIMDNSGNTDNAYGGLLKAQAGYYQHATANLFNAQDTNAQYQDKAYDINKMQPYLRALQRKYDLKGAGISNIASGLNSATKDVSGAFGLASQGNGQLQQGNLGGSIGGSSANLFNSNLA